MTLLCLNKFWIISVSSLRICARLIRFLARVRHQIINPALSSNKLAGLKRETLDFLFLISVSRIFINNPALNFFYPMSAGPERESPKKEE